jgi:SecY interacting protein Syd
MLEVTRIFAELLQKAQQQAANNGEVWRSYADPALMSPCQYGDVEAELVSWWPAENTDTTDFSGLEQALELSLNAELKAFFSAYYGAGLPLQHPRGPVELLMVWHQADFERLQQNIIAHILMKRRLKQRETIFFAVTDDDDMMLSVLNCTGEVYLERAGTEVKEKLADSLGAFLQQLTVPHATPSIGT